MKEILEAVPFGIIVLENNKLKFINNFSKKFLGLKLEEDIVNLGAIQGRIGKSMNEIKEREVIKILGKKLIIKKTIFNNLTIITLIEEEKKETELLSYLSHEIRVPLSTVTGACETIFDGVLGDLNEKQKGYLEIALRNCKRMKDLIEETFNMQAIEKETDKLEFKVFSLDKFFNETIDSILLSKKVNIKVFKEIDEKVKKYYGYGDQSKLTQVYTNIILNAIRHSITGNIYLEIKIEEEDNKNFAIISITNDGKEIKDEEREKIFLPYYHTGQEKGLGLGLAISKKIIEKHEGKIDFISKEGKTTFFFSFPAIEILRKKILLVEDDLDLQEVTRNFLEISGYEVKVSSSGKEALKILENFLPDLIITDLMMPDGTGWELLKSLKNFKKKPKIIVISGATSLLDHSIVLDILKVDLFINKPFELKKLLADVKNLLKGD